MTVVEGDTVVGDFAQVYFFFVNLSTLVIMLLKVVQSCEILTVNIVDQSFSWHSMPTFKAEALCLVSNV